MARIKVGCCGFPVRMSLYFDSFKLVEIQQTFYNPPKLETALEWRNKAPEDFEFSLKAWQLITHTPQSPTYRKARIEIPPQEKDLYGFFRPTPKVREAWLRTLEIARALRAKIIVFQCPPGFHETPENVENLRSFFKSAERGDLLFVWEPRGRWKEETIRNLCRELDLIHGVDPFARSPLYGLPRYFRLHGGPGYRHQYTDEELFELYRIAREADSYVLFNNMSMYDDATRFKRILEAQGREI